MQAPLGREEEPAVPHVIDLADPDAGDPHLVGAKAANLALSMQAGLEILPGFALTTTAAGCGIDDPSVSAALHDAWSALVRQEPGPVVVRSSSTVEDAAESSMAGQFTSVLDVHDWPSLRDAVTRVLDSAGRVAGADAAQPMAVLVQPQLHSVVGGVMFGVDPVSGDRHHVVVDAVSTRVDDLVSGRVTAAHYVLSRRGRVIEVVHPDVAPALRRSQRHALVALARSAERVFGTPQDLEWAIDAKDRLWLLQSRPVTAVMALPSSVLLGPGPVAETFPHALRALESDLWLQPLREAIVRALTTTRAVSRRRLHSSPVLTSVGGYAAVDVDMLGVTRARRSRWRLLDPRPGARRLLAAWRVGRLRVALPVLTAEVIGVVDDDLAGIGALDRCTEDELLRLIDEARRELATVHALEILTGMLATADGDDPPLPVVGLCALADGRAAGLSDAQIIARSPEVLALVPPSVDCTLPLPRTTDVGEVGTRADVAALGGRDALRLRTRWLQELLARLARTLADRLAERGVLPDPRAARDCTIEELAVMVRGGDAPTELAARSEVVAGPPLPATFRLTSDGRVVPRAAGRDFDGVPAGGGRAVGIARRAFEGVVGSDGAADTVLVVAHLEPQLAGVLPGLVGLVAETGSALSHLAILAREMHVPTVVAVPDARRRFPPGTRVLVDGATGEVTTVAEAEST